MPAQDVIAVIISEWLDMLGCYGSPAIGRDWYKGVMSFFPSY